MTPADREHFGTHEIELQNGSKATIRPLSTGDGQLLADFYATVPREDYRFYWPHKLDAANALRNAANADSSLEVVLVLEMPDKTIGGYAWYRWKTADAAKSGFGICIRRDNQGVGAGRALMEDLAEISVQLGPPVMALTVQEANPRAVALYRKMGFKVVREQMRGANVGCGAPAEPEYAMERQVR